uniref:Uncharacterized protein n=1 Tax=Timema cristinae TaxID=61476 RepID=A0A7R9H3G9_TIMCR|nr:unnamed protein product [Timema cristinae]
MVRRSRGLVVVTAAACVEVLLTMLGTSGGVDAETLVWSEEFDVFDLSVWNHLVSGSRGFNNEFEYYRNNRKNSFVKDGVLYLKPTLTAADYGERFLYQGGLSHRDCNLSPCETLLEELGEVLQPVPLRDVLHLEQALGGARRGIATCPLSRREYYT